MDLHPHHKTGANGMTEGDRVVEIYSGRHGVAIEFLQDGDAEVHFDDGGPPQCKWNNLVLERGYNRVMEREAVERKFRIVVR